MRKFSYMAYHELVLEHYNQRKYHRGHGRIYSMNQQQPHVHLSTYRLYIQFLFDIQVYIRFLTRVFQWKSYNLAQIFLKQLEKEDCNSYESTNNEWIPIQTNTIYTHLLSIGLSGIWIFPEEDTFLRNSNRLYTIFLLWVRWVSRGVIWS